MGLVTITRTGWASRGLDYRSAEFGIDDDEDEQPPASTASAKFADRLSGLFSGKMTGQTAAHC